MVRDIQYGEPSTACIEVQIFYRGGEGFLLVEATSPKKHRYFTDQNNDISLPLASFANKKISDHTIQGSSKWDRDT